MTIDNRTLLVLAVAGLALTFFAFNVGSTQAAAIYEPFSQPAGSLGGATGGTGLNTWSVNQNVNVVETPTLSYGNLQNDGGQANVVNGNGTDAWVTTTSPACSMTVRRSGSAPCS